jgi:hypothetical protein
MQMAQGLKTLSHFFMHIVKLNVNNLLIKHFQDYEICFIFVITKNKIKMKTVELTMQEIWQATRPNIQKNKKKYERKPKHKKRYEE